MDSRQLPDAERFWGQPRGPHHADSHCLKCAGLLTCRPAGLLACAFETVAFCCDMVKASGGRSSCSKWSCDAAPAWLLLQVPRKQCKEAYIQAAAHFWCMDGNKLQCDRGMPALLASEFEQQFQHGCCSYSPASNAKRPTIR